MVYCGTVTGLEASSPALHATPPYQAPKNRLQLQVNNIHLSHPTTPAEVLLWSEL